MKNRYFFGLCCGVALGLLAGYLLAVAFRPSSTHQPGPKAESDHVLESLDLQDLVAVVGDGKWTLVQIPNDSVRELHTKPWTSPPTHAHTHTRCYVARCDMPGITADQEHDFFQKMQNRLRAALDTQAVVETGGSIEGVPLFLEKDKGRYRYSCTPIHFHTTADPSRQRGGSRGSAVMWLTSDGESAVLFVTLTEVNQGGG